VPIAVVRVNFAAAAGSFADLLDRIPTTAWDGPGLGDWDLRALVGHTSRALTTVTSYLRRPAAAELVPDAAGYYALLKQQSDVDQSAVAERGRQAGVALGDDPVSVIHQRVDETLAVLASVVGDPIIETIAGGMRLDAYLPTRTFELAVHSLDIAGATGMRWTLPPAVLSEALHLAADVALRGADGATVLFALTGRRELPSGYSIL
jgi:hypothetical protein